MSTNLVRRSGIVRALSALGFAMMVMPAIMLAAYAALAFAAVVIAVVIAVVVSHPFRRPAPVLTVPNAHDDEAARAHRARMAAILGR